MARAAKVKAGEPHELIWLGFEDRARFQDALVPFAFLLSDVGKVWSCRVRDVAGELGLERTIGQSLGDSVEMIVHHLCVADRPKKTDLQIVEGLTRGPSIVRVHSSRGGLNLDKAGEEARLITEGVKLFSAFIMCRHQISFNMNELLKHIGAEAQDLTTAEQCVRDLIIVR